jgi:hypothetical protein
LAEPPSDPDTKDPTTGGEQGKPWLALVLVAGCAVLAWARSRPPPPRGTEARPSEFSAIRALDTLALIPGVRMPHPVGTQAHEHVREGILTELRRLGLEPRVEESAAISQNSLALVHNVVAEIPGIEVHGIQEEKAVLLCAHYDSVPAGPGAGDDGSGVATLLEVARALRAGPPLRRPVILLADDAEECGLVGAEAFVARHRVQDEIEVVVNVDARGTRGPTYLFETSRGNADLVRLYAEAVDRPCATSAAYEVYKRMPNSTDLSVFIRSGRVAGLNFAFIGGLRRYHTPVDDLEHLSPASLQHEGDQVLALVRALAREDYQPKTEEDLVYTDVLGFFLLRWPAKASLPLAITILSVLLLRFLVRPRASRRAADLLRGALKGLTTIGASALAAAAIVAGIELVRADPEAWAGTPLPFWIAIFSGAVLASLLLARIPLFSRIPATSARLGVWILFAAAGVLQSAALPGTSYLFIVPAGLAAILELSRSDFLAATIPACALVLLGTPLALGLEAAVELRVPLALGLPLGTTLAALGPCLAGAGARARRAAMTLASVLLATSTAWAFAVDASTPDRPHWLPLVHLEGPEDGRARTFALTYGEPLPNELRAQGAFGMEPERPFPELRSLPAGFARPSEPAPADAARIEVLATRRDQDARLIDVRISSPRGAPCLLLHLRGLLDKKNDNGVPSAMLGASQIREPIREAESGAPQDGVRTWESHLILFGIPPDGIVFTLRAPLDRAAEILLLDVAYGLPPCDAEIARARPDRCVPRGQGDQWVVARRREL